MEIVCQIIDGLLRMNTRDNEWSNIFENSEEDRETIKQMLADKDNDIRIKALKSVYEGTDVSIVEDSDPDFCWIPLTWEIMEGFWGTEPTVFKIVRSFGDLVSQKQKQIKAWCSQAITNGFSIDLGLTDKEGTPLGELHYTLSDRNQTDMRDLADMIAAGATKVTWRDDSRVSHMVYTAEQFMKLYQATRVFILQCRFKSDGLEELLFSYTEEDAEKVEAIEWDTELPPEIQQNVDELLKTMTVDN